MTTEPRGYFYQNETHVRYRRILTNGVEWHNIGIHCDVQYPREYVCQVLGENERQHLPEDTYENCTYTSGLFEAAQKERDEQERTKSLSGRYGRVWGLTSHNAHGYRP